MPAATIRNGRIVHLLQCIGARPLGDPAPLYASEIARKLGFPLTDLPGRGPIDAHVFAAELREELLEHARRRNELGPRAILDAVADVLRLTSLEPL